MPTPCSYTGIVQLCHVKGRGFWTQGEETNVRVAINWLMLFISPNSSSYKRPKEPYFLVTDTYYYKILTLAAEDVAPEVASLLPQLLVVDPSQDTEIL